MFNYSSHLGLLLSSNALLWKPGFVTSYLTIQHTEYVTLYDKVKGLCGKQLPMYSWGTKNYSLIRPFKTFRPPKLRENNTCSAKSTCLNLTTTIVWAFKMHFFCLPILYLHYGGLKYRKGVYTAIQMLYKYLFNSAAVGQCGVCEVWAFIASRSVLMLTQRLKSKADRGRHETHPGGLYWGIYDHFTLDQDGILCTAFLQALVIFKGSDSVLNNLWTGNVGGIPCFFLTWSDRGS